MCLAAAYELANFAEERGIHDENISPTMDEWEASIREAVAVGMKAIEQGVAREAPSREELTRQAEKMIKESREATALLMKSELIPPVPEE
jgi:malate dehydrogenase (oxaloacetate-decarboxylating)